MEVRAPASDAVSLKVVTWNMKMTNGATGIDFLESQPWQVACLQEISPRASEAIESRGWSSVNGVRLAWDEEYRHWRRWPHAAAVVAREGWTLEGEAMSGTPKPGRGIVASATNGLARATVISWHAPNAAGEGVGTKMAGYKALVDALNAATGPIVAGIDSNHWSLSAELDGEAFVPGSRWDLENQFFSRTPQHRLRDVLIDYLRSHPGEYRLRKRERPGGPLDITFKRGKTYDRFDYIFVSDEISVRRVSHLWKEGGVGGSDHGMVLADLAVHSCDGSE